MTAGQIDGMQSELDLLGLEWSQYPFDRYTHHLNSKALYVCIPVNFDWQRISRRFQLEHRFMCDLRGQTVLGITEADQQRVVPHPYNHKKSHVWLLLEKVSQSDLDPIRVTMFNGGTYRFPYSAWTAVQAARKLDIVTGYPLFDNEIANSSEGVKFFVELDYTIQLDQVFSEMDIPSLPQLTKDALLIHEKLKSVYLCSDHTCVLLVCQMKMKKDNLIAIGSHLVFTSMVVDTYTGARLCNILKEMTNLNIDSAPYKSTSASLRPAFSRKIGQCTECQNHPMLIKGCRLCDRQGKIGMGSFYVPRKVITHEGDIREYNGESTSIIPLLPGYFSNIFA